jgi:hypothetical protein
VRTPITPLQLVWALSSLVGLVAVGWPALHVADGATLWAELTRSWSTRTIALDLLLLGIPVVVFAVVEARRLRWRWPWLWAILAVPLPGAFLIPLFFLLRERALIRASRPSS